ncbi:MAG: precorrin-6Y C5,15-methyltransferase (decarboxylating) subunit CbiT, partial [Nitratireductor sp.]
AVFYGRVGGLPDDAFVHDGQMTKRIVRAASISSLRPFQNALLWDIGAGCGSVAIEWMRVSQGAKAVCVEPNDARLKMMSENALALGVPKLVAVKGTAPDAISEMQNDEMPDAIFIGGGITSKDVFETCWASLKAGGRLVANAVTLESEARLLELHQSHGGTLDRITTSSAIRVGKYNAMKPSMSVMQLVLTKPFGAAHE